MKTNILLFALLSIFLLVGCQQQTQEEKYATIKFITYSEQKLDDVKVTESTIDSFVLPTVTKEGNEFVDWFYETNFQTKVTIPSIKEKLNNGVIKIYAKWNKLGDQTKVNVNGIIDEKVVVNPSFDWENPFGDSAFNLTIKDADENTIIETVVEDTHYEIESPLEYNKTYTVNICGQDSGITGIVNLETIDGTGKVNLNVQKLNVCEPFKSHMVIQRGKDVNITGETKANVLVTLEFKGKIYNDISDDKGNFEFTLPAMEANTIATEIIVRISPTKKLVLEDILVGDVYLVSGQSNVQWELKNSDYEPMDVENAVKYNVRYYSQSTSTSNTPIDTIKNGKWFKVDKSDTGYTYYSAVAFMIGSMLGKELHSENVPLGIVYAAQGDTNIANWMSNDYYTGTVSTKHLHYNAMIHPLRNMNLTGVVWYQGCNNSAKGTDYKDLLKGLFANWRDLFNNEDMPFYVVQLPVYDGDSGNNYDFSYVRESQLNACQEDENAYIIATCDGGDPTFIHPTEKRYICERVTKSILSTVYGRDYSPESPTYKEHTVNGNSVVITVNNGEGLYSDGEIVGFMLAGADGKYFDANAIIENGKIIVTSSNVANPVYIKYGFGKSPFINIYNDDDFLLSPFRTDDHNCNIDLLDYSNSAKYKTHQDGSAIEYNIVNINGEVGTEIIKKNDGKTFGSLQLDKWGAIGYKESVLRISVIGTNSNAKISFRIVEGSYEIWAYTFVDNFTGKKTFEIPTSELNCVYNQIDKSIDYQAIMNIEYSIETSSEAKITILETRFIEKSDN